MRYGRRRQTNQSVSCDVDITELVDGNVGVHVMIPKSIFPRGAGERMIPVKR